MRETLRKIIFGISLLVFLGTLAIIIYYFGTRYMEESERDDLKGLITENTTEDSTDSTSTTEQTDKGLDYYIIDGVIVQAKFKDIYLKNHDFIGWLEAKNTKIDYPVVYTPDNIQYYIRKNFDKDYSIAGTLLVGEGTDLSVNNLSENTIIYGHNMNDNSMFGGLFDYEDEDYYKRHRYIEFDSLERNGKYEVIATFKTTVNMTPGYEGFDVYTGVNMDKKQFDEYVKTCLEKTPYKTVDSVDYSEKLLTLSTCSYHNSYGRYVVIARLVEETTVDLSKEPIEVINTTDEE